MSEIPADLRYATTHEWVRDEGDGVVTVGITDHAQAELGDLVFVQLPGEEGAVEAGAACAVVESVKTASDIHAPVDGEIIATHDAVADDPEQVNTDPYGEGWLFTLRMVDSASLDELLDADGYAELIDDEA